MVLYDELKNSIEINDNYIENGVNRGFCGEVYHFGNDECVKIYYSSCHTSRLKKEIYNELKTIKSDFLVYINKILYYENVKDEIAGYTMPYYSDKLLSIIDYNIDFTLYILEEWLKLVEELSLKKIIIDDVKRRNTVYSDNKIIIIDPDKFFKSIKSSNFCKIENKKRILYLLKSIYHFEAIDILNTSYNNYNPFNSLDKLFYINPKEDIIKCLSKKLHGYSCPRDYFLDHNN